MENNRFHGTINLIPGSGLTIQNAIKAAIEISNAYTTKVTFDFNDVHMEINPNSDFDNKYTEWREKENQHSIEYESSDAGKRLARDIEESKKTAQKNLDNLIGSINTIDFTDLEQVIPFLEKIIDNANTMGTYYDSKKLDDILKVNGYSANMNADTESHKLNQDDKDAVGKYLVGQFMNHLMGFVEVPAVATAMEQWEEKFVKPDTEERNSRHI